ncbi:MAG: hypothetical protein ACRBBP_09010 [Bdellovibrionales bacterium]
MKFFLIITCILLGPVVSGAQSVTCITMPIATSFQFNVEDEKARLSISHNTGVEHAPIASGVITGSDLKGLEQRLEYVTKMGAYFSVDFDIENCKFDAKDELACVSKNSVKIGSLNVEGYHFLVAKEITKTKHGEFVSHRVSFDYRVKSRLYPMTMNYYGEDCSFK